MINNQMGFELVCSFLLILMNCERTNELIKWFLLIVSKIKLANRVLLLEKWEEKKHQNINSF